MMLMTMNVFFFIDSRSFPRWAGTFIQGSRGSRSGDDIVKRLVDI